MFSEGGKCNMTLQCGICVCISCIKIPSSLSLDLSLALSLDSKRTKALSSIKSEDGFEKC